MAVIQKRRRADGSTAYRAIVRVRRDGKTLYSKTHTFDRRATAKEWARQEEARLDRPGELAKAGYRDLTVGGVLRRYLDSYGDRFGRTKYHHVEFLSRLPIADEPVIDLTSSRIVRHAEERRKNGAGPTTIGNDLTWLQIAFRYARSALGAPVPLEPLKDARNFLNAERLITRARRRDRRPTPDELRRLDEYFRWKETKPGKKISVPMRDILWFALHSTRRQAEITRLLHADNDPESQTGLVRDAKHPRQKEGNHKRFKYTREAWEIVQRQPDSPDGRIFPFSPKTIGTYFTKACRFLEIEDFRFHDLRHEGTSRLFEAGYSIQDVSLFTLHEDWNQLRRYTHLRPQEVQLR